MKCSSKVSFLAVILLICVPVFFVISQTQASQEPEESQETSVVEEEKEIPESVPMTLEAIANPYDLPADFGGSDPEKGNLQWLEDAGVLMAENSSLYNTPAAGIGANTKFEEPPAINWEVKKEDSAGNLITESSEPTNMAVNSSNIKSPGYYQVHNGGARLVSTEAGADGEDIATASGTEEAMVTSQQRVGIQVHDCTAPDLWVAFQEGAGKVDMAENEDALRTDMKAKIIETGGHPISPDSKAFEEASYIFLDEGKDRDLNPSAKTARFTIAGPLFYKDGLSEITSGVVKSNLGASYRNSVMLVGGSGKDSKGSIFVRRNVPFIFAAVTTDNGDQRQTVKAVEGSIRDKDSGEEIEKDGDSYIFRVPNYPRGEYEDQPDYYFTANTEDSSGNTTVIEMPLYVVNTQAVFEGGQNQ